MDYLSIMEQRRKELAEKEERAKVEAMNGKKFSELQISQLQWIYENKKNECEKLVADKNYKCQLL